MNMDKHSLAKKGDSEAPTFVHWFLKVNYFMDFWRYIEFRFFWLSNGQGLEIIK